LSENGKWCRRFFATRSEAEKFIFEIKRRGSVQLAELSIEEMHVLGVIRQSEKYEPRLLLEAWRRFEAEGVGKAADLTVQQLCEKFLGRQKAEGRSAQTLMDDRWRLNAFCRVLGPGRTGAVKRSDVLGYLESIGPGTNRRSHYKTLRKLWRWAFDLGHVEHDPMARLKPLDSWGVNNEVLNVELFRRFLRVAQGLEAPREGTNASGRYERLLPYFVLGGLQGLRNCEMVRERADYPVIEELGRRFPSEEILEKLAAALNVSLAELKKYDNREPIADLKRLMDSDPKLGFAFRTAVEKLKSGELTADDIIARLTKSPRKK